MSLLEIALQIEKDISKMSPIDKSDKSKNIIDLTAFLNMCCYGLNTSPEEVKSLLLHQGNIEDIINGDIPAKCIRAHIELWVVEGKNNYVNAG